MQLQWMATLFVGLLLGASAARTELSQPEFTTASETATEPGRAADPQNPSNATTFGTSFDSNVNEVSVDIDLNASFQRVSVDMVSFSADLVAYLENATGCVGSVRVDHVMPSSCADSRTRALLNASAPRAVDFPILVSLRGRGQETASKSKVSRNSSDSGVEVGLVLRPCAQRNLTSGVLAGELRAQVANGTSPLRSGPFGHMLCAGRDALQLPDAAPTGRNRTVGRAVDGTLDSWEGNVSTAVVDLRGSVRRLNTIADKANSLEHLVNNISNSFKNIVEHTARSTNKLQKLAGFESGPVPVPLSREEKKEIARNPLQGFEAAAAGTQTQFPEAAAPAAATQNALR